MVETKNSEDEINTQEANKVVGCNESFFGYIPNDSNGVIFILKEPGGKKDDYLDMESNRKGNGEWFRNSVCDEICKTKKVPLYRNRYLDLLEVVGKERSVDELARCYYTCISYEGKSTSTQKEGSCYNHIDKKARFLAIKSAFLENLKKLGIKEAIIFVHYDTFNCLEEDFVSDGLLYGDEKQFKMFRKTEDGITYACYAIQHPLGCSAHIRLKDS